MSEKAISSVVIIGPAWPLRGGLASFDQRLCRQFLHQGFHCSIYSFSLQYPAFLFPGTSQYADGPAPDGITIHSVINSVSPINWWITGNRIRKLKPDLVVVRYWLPFMGPALGTILRRIKMNRHTRIVAVTDNVIPHEKRPGDRLFTRYFLSPCDAFLTMSDNVLQDLSLFNTRKPMQKVWHPLYDNFGAPVEKMAARQKLGLPTDKTILLFFGFIRPYKGLDLLLEAMALLKKEIDKEAAAEGHHPCASLRLLIAGEFYEDAGKYHTLIQTYNLEAYVILRTDFIPDEDVRYYVSAADGVIQPYRSATQSGVTPLAYHFEKPMIVTNVGSLPDLVPHDKVGLVCTPTAESIAQTIQSFIEKGEGHFLKHLQQEKQKYSWEKFVNVLIDLAQR